MNADYVTYAAAVNISLIIVLILLRRLQNWLQLIVKEY